LAAYMTVSLTLSKQIGDFKKNIDTILGKVLMIARRVVGERHQPPVLALVTKTTQGTSCLGYSHKET
jgi:hypothetical protein